MLIIHQEKKCGIGTFYERNREKTTLTEQKTTTTTATTKTMMFHKIVVSEHQHEQQPQQHPQLQLPAPKSGPQCLAATSTSKAICITGNGSLAAHHEPPA